MNLFVFVDKNQKLISCDNIKNLNNCKNDLASYATNKLVVFDKTSRPMQKDFDICKKIFFNKNNDNTPEFFKEVDAKSCEITNFKQLFELKKKYNDENIFLFGDDFVLPVWEYMERIYLIRINKNFIQGEKFNDLLENKKFEIVYNGCPFFEDNQEYSISIFKNKNPEKYESK